MKQETFYSAQYRAHETLLCFVVIILWPQDNNLIIIRGHALLSCGQKKLIHGHVLLFFSFNITESAPYRSITLINLPPVAKSWEKYLKKNSTAGIFWPNAVSSTGCKRKHKGVNNDFSN